MQDDPEKGVYFQHKMILNDFPAHVIPPPDSGLDPLVRFGEYSFK